VLAAEVLQRDGGTAWLQPEAFSVAYRSVQAPEGVLGFLAARFHLEADDAGRHADATRISLTQRKATQPVGKPSAGSTFRNPPGDFAARLIDSCGLKGERIGGAQVSGQHANFILTEPGATAADVEKLISRVQATVLERTGVHLEPEVRIVGEAVHA